MDNPSMPGTQEPQQLPKENTGKIIIIVIAVVGLLCMLACAAIVLLTGRLGSQVAKNVDTEPAGVESASDKIASFELPPGYQPQTSMSLLGMTFAMYEAPEKSSAMVVFQMPTAMEMTDENIRQMEEQLRRQSNNRLENIKTVEEYDATIRGKPGRVIIQEGENDGTTFRQMLVVFQGKGGLAMAMIFGPKQGWDQAVYDSFVESIQ